MAKMTGARYIAEALDGYGVTHVFFVPTILSRALVEMEERTNISRIMTHGEKAAVYMADGYARASGRPGICMAQTVGAANLAAGLRDPYLACTPMVALTGGPTANSRDRNVYQEIDDYPLFKPVTKSSYNVDRVERLPDALRQAFRAATTGTPGPAHVQIMGHAGDIETQEGEMDPFVEERFGSVPPFRPAADPTDVQAAVRLLERAAKPIMVIGGGARSSGAREEVVELAETLNIPVATSLNGKSQIPGDHPLNVGVVGSYSRESANRAVMEADLVFFVGSHTGSQVTNSWTVPTIGTPAIQLDISAEELGKAYPLQASVLGDAKTALRQMIDAADGGTAAQRSEWTQRTQQLVQEYQDKVADLQNSEQEPIRPERVTKELSQHMPSDTILVADTGHAGMWTGGMIDLNKPGQDFLRAAGSLGWGLPGALGAKLGAPERPVVLWSGDGGFWYHIAELETAVRWNINAVLLVNNNGALNQEIHPYSQAYGGELHGKHEELWHFRKTDFVQVAESMGASGLRVTKPSELGGAIEKALTMSGPVVVDVVTDIEALAPGALSSL